LPDPDWAEAFAHSLGVQAYIYAFPWYYNSLLRWKWTTQKPANIATTPFAEVNAFWCQPQLMDHSYRDGGRPNNDTLYSVAWLDLGHEPVIVSVPDMAGRYYSVQLAGFDADNFDYIGTRATGSAAGHFAIAGPGWQGELPPGVRSVTPSPTTWALAIGRVLVDGPHDLAEASARIGEITVTPLSRWLGGNRADVAAPARRPVLPPFDRAADPMADWRTINRAMTEIPPPAADADLVKLFAQIGIGPGQELDRLDTGTRRGLLRALDTARGIVTATTAYAVGSTWVNGWCLTPPNWGRLGRDRDFLVRAGKSLGGIISNDTQENVYYTMVDDADGKRLSGAGRYQLRFPKGQLPPALAFWSVTVYDTDYNLIANAIGRYAIGDRTQGLAYDEDGGLTLYVQRDAPGEGGDSNWLPVGSGEFHLRLRLYFPAPAVVSQQWMPPAIETIGPPAKP
jgi:hypothetical protein